MCAALGKFPHEFSECTVIERRYLVQAWNAINQQGEE